MGFGSNVWAALTHILANQGIQAFFTLHPLMEVLVYILQKVCQALL